MNLHEKYYLLKKMVQYIELEITGNSNDFAEKLKISRSQLFIEIEVLRCMGVDVLFNRYKKSFVFAGNKKIAVREPIVIIDNNDLADINAGFIHKKSSVHFSGLNNTIFA